MNPYLKKYGPGGETNNPYDPTTSYIRPKKVNVDGKEISTYSNDYRDLYNSGTVLPVYEGLPAVYAPEVEVTAEAPEWLKEKRRIEAQGRVAESVRKGTGSFARPILETGLELSGVPGAVRFSKDPIKNLQGTANILSYTNVPGLIGHGIDYAMGNPFFNVTEEDLQGLGNTLDVAGLATLGAGTAFKMAPKAISSIPRMFGKIPDVNPNIGLRFVDKSIDASKNLQKVVFRPINTSSINNTTKGFEPTSTYKQTPTEKVIGESNMMKTESNVVSYYEDLINRLKTTEEGKRRLANMGLEPEDINDFFVTFKKNEGNYVTTGIDYNTGNPFINIDFEKTDLLNQGLLPAAKGNKYGLTYGITAAHEAAHALDMIKAYKNYKNAKKISDNLWETKYKSKFYGSNRSKYEDEYFDYLNNDLLKRTPDQYTYDQYVNDYLRFETPAKEPNKVSYFYKPYINNLNKEAKGVYGDPSIGNIETPDFNPIKLSSFEQKALDDARYFTHGIEPYAHVREFRRGMMEKGILKNEWDPVTKTMIDRYMKSDVNDRIKGFMKNTPDFRKRMKRWLNKYPAVIPAAIGTGVVGASMIQQPKEKFRNGGYVNPYLR